jgi:hypothetical protein
MRIVDNTLTKRVDTLKPRTASDLHGKPVHTANLTLDICRNMSGINFGWADSDSPQNPRIYLWFTGDPIVAGWVSFEVFRGNTHSYGVASRLVVQQRDVSYHRGGSANIKSTGNATAALRLAKKLIRRWTVPELCSLGLKRLLDKYTESRSRFRGELFRAYGDIIETRYYGASKPHETQLAIELVHLFRTGHKFLSDKFTEQVASLAESMVEWSQDSAASTSLGCNYVNVTQDHSGRNVFRVVEIPPGCLAGRDDLPKDAPVRNYTEDELPEVLAGRLSVLSMCEADQYVDFVGMRRGDNEFYAIV